jgi:hypothetical protein
MDIQSYELKGGDISRDKIFSKILSIGYELETNDLIKFTKISQEDPDTNNPILINTDTARNDIDKLTAVEKREDNKTKQESEGEGHEDNDEVDDEEEDEDEEYYYDEDAKMDLLLRQEETFEIPTGIPDAFFYITNDLSDHSPIHIALKEICPTIYSFDEKDKLYTLQSVNKTNEPKTYNLNFIFSNQKTALDCSSFSDVEWISTFYKPPNHSNIIVETFKKTVEILLKHLNSLKNVGEMNIIMHTDNPQPELNKITLDINDKTVFPLYNMPEMNEPNSESDLYYLQIRGNSIGNVCIVPQMTFAAKAEDVFPIMKKMIENNLQSMECVNNTCDRQMNIFTAIDNCTKELIQKYNDSDTPYKIVYSNENSVLYNRIFNYIDLILYKLYVYYNVYLPRGKKRYFKDYLSMNSRHSNFVFYTELKKSLMKLFSNQSAFQTMSEQERKAEIVKIVKDIVIQPDILNEYMLEDTKNARKNVFSKTNPFTVSDFSYGNPSKSLVSYFDFFENPSPGTDSEKLDNLYVDNTFINHDWLEYKKIDYYSNKMDLKDDIVLIEFRIFRALLINYIYNIFTPEERDTYFGPTFQRKICVNLLDEFIKRYNTMHGLQNVTLESETQRDFQTETQLMNQVESRQTEQPSMSLESEIEAQPVSMGANLGGRKTAKHKHHKQKTIKERIKTIKAKTSKQKHNKNNSSFKHK